jgi:hypothetical protein
LSVELYISKATEGIQKRIKENIEFAKANPYPKDELKSALDLAGPGSALSKLYTLTGQTKDFTSQPPGVMAAAKQQADVYPGLFTRLRAGQISMNKLELDKGLDRDWVENSLNSAFIRFINELNKFISLGANIKIEDIFSDKTNNNTFEEYLDEFNINLNSFGADSLLRPAFTELFNKQQSIPKPVESKPSAVNAASVPTESKKGTSPVNATTTGPKPTEPIARAPINPTATKSVEPTSVTNLEGSVTSKAGELQTENILETEPSKAISINLENKPIESKSAAGATSNSSTTSTTSNSTTVNDASSASSVTGNLLNTSTNTGVTGDKNIMNVANTTNQSSSGTVNENKPEKEKGGFLSKVGNLAKKAGAVLNLPSIGTLGEQAKGLFGAAGANISSRISEVKESFAINSNKSESQSSPTSSTTTNSVNSSNTSTNTAPNVLAVPNTSAVSNTENLLKTETQNSMNVEQKLPGVTATSTPAPVVSAQIAPVASTVVSNAVNSQTGSSPQTTNTTTAQNIQAAGQPASTPPGMGVNVDMNQLAQSIMRLERILISGIDVTIKDA